jgi:hypothetical protein
MKLTQRSWQGLGSTHSAERSDVKTQAELQRSSLGFWRRNANDEGGSRFAGACPSADPGRAATTTIPIVFRFGAAPPSGLASFPSSTIQEALAGAENQEQPQRACRYAPPKILSHPTNSAFANQQNASIGRASRRR